MSQAKSSAAAADTANRVIARFASLDAKSIAQLARSCDTYSMEQQSLGVSVPGLFLTVRQAVPQWPIFDLRLREAREAVREAVADTEGGGGLQDQIEMDAGIAVAYAVVAAISTGVDREARTVLAKPWDDLMRALGTPGDAVFGTD